MRVPDALIMQVFIGHLGRFSGRCCSVSRLKLAKLLLVIIFVTLSTPPLFGAKPPSRKFELRGRILLPPGTIGAKRWVSVNLFAVGTPFYKRTIARSNGRFDFKNVAPGTYTIAFSLPKLGQIIRTIELTPSFADAKGRIEKQFEYSPDQLAVLIRPEDRSTVSVTELKVTYGSRREFERAQADLRENDADGALEHLHKAIKESPDFLEAINSVGVIYFQRKQYVEAEKYFRMAVEIDENALEPRLNLGGVLLSQGKGDEALRVNLGLYEELPQEALAAAQLGFSYYLLKDYGQAIRYLDAARELDPAHFTFPQITLAEIFLHLGQPDDADTEIDEFLRLHPDSAEVAKAHELQKSAREMIRNQALADEE